MPRRTFEALFHAQGVPMSEALRAALREHGLDLGQLNAEYPLTTLRTAFELARQHAFGYLPEAEGFREVGRCFVRGFSQTALGWVFRTTATLFGPERTLQTLPRYLSSVRRDLPLVVVPSGERSYRLVCQDAAANPHFLAGCIEVVLTTSGAQAPRAEVEVDETGAFELFVSWS